MSCLGLLMDREECMGEVMGDCMERARVWVRVCVENG
jgi:hypothetical protein